MRGKSARVGDLVLNMSSTEPQLDVLAVFSHPDDAELSVAGTLLKLKSFGYRTGVAT